MPGTSGGQNRRLQPSTGGGSGLSQEDRSRGASSLPAGAEAQGSYSQQKPQWCLARLAADPFFVPCGERGLGVRPGTSGGPDRAQRVLQPSTGVVPGCHREIEAGGGGRRPRTRKRDYPLPRFGAGTQVLASGPPADAEAFWLRISRSRRPPAGNAYGTSVEFASPAGGGGRRTASLRSAGRRLASVFRGRLRAGRWCGNLL